ncbi:sensor histidine kinase [Luteolibacter arcticus]|uniref:Sensor histidine kinase n=1 Tax=Luteolibacter arcticus TaxID=1581411 RepID=A0ABT3GJ41_9BACT|nr:sensor histidine kinase [Luteolibacter arcticus]MCW1923543.1 sensor histidine kinase [Luteolibacter arcticus]
MSSTPSITRSGTGQAAAKSTVIDRPMPGLMRSLRWLEDRSPVVVWVLAAALIAVIGIFSWVSGPELSGSLLYLIPVLLVGHVAGFRSGVIAALLAASIWFTADMNGGTGQGPTFTPYWNALMRFGTFLVAVGLVAATRSLNAQLEERVKERTAALEAQIVENRELEKSILDISDREQVRIGQDLHDSLCQQLVSVAFSANMLQERLEKEGVSANQDAARIADLIDDSINQARNLARGLYPVRLETEGLELALRELAATMSRRFQVSCTVECSGPVPPCQHAVGIHFYRIAQEAVVNAAKHARAQHVTLSLAATRGQVKLNIDDDGEGIIRVPRNPDGMGLRIMAYRARMIGADFQIAHRLPRGTSVSCELEEVAFSAA